MKEIWLIRHACPEFAPGQKICLGHTDLPLGPIGMLQRTLLSEVLKEPFDMVYSSPLSRAYTTAEALTSEPIVVPDLKELNCGDWDGYDFCYIKEHWSSYYEQRGLQPLLPPPNGESLESGLNRFLAAIEWIVHQPGKRIAIVAHLSVIQAFLCHVMHTPLSQYRQYQIPYASITTLRYEEEIFQVTSIGRSPHPEMTEALCERLLLAVQTPAPVTAHCKAVAGECMRVMDALSQERSAAERAMLSSAALLHDIARTRPDHAKTGAYWLESCGYPQLASIIRQHHDLDASEPAELLSEADLLYLADKCILGTTRVCIEERFAASKKKCATPAAMQALERRLQTTLRIKNTVNSLCQNQIIF